MKNNIAIIKNNNYFKYHIIGTSLNSYINDKFYQLLMEYINSKKINRLIYSKDKANKITVSEDLRKWLSKSSYATFEQFKKCCLYFELIYEEKDELYISEKIIKISNEDEIEKIKLSFDKHLLETWNSKINEFYSFLQYKCEDNSSDIDRVWLDEYSTTFSLLMDNNIDNLKFKDKVLSLGSFNYFDGKNRFWNLRIDFKDENYTDIVEKIKNSATNLLALASLNKTYEAKEEIFSSNLRAKIDSLSKINWKFNVDDFKQKYHIQNIEVKNLNVHDYFERSFVNISTINVPVYQRNYVWDFNIIKVLLDDIKNINVDKKEHFISTIIFSHDIYENSYSIIDGQQRTTTLLLIAFAIYIYYVNNIDIEKEEFKKIPDLFNKMFGTHSRLITEKFKNLSDSCSYEQFNKIIDLDPEMDKNDNKDNLLRNNLIEIYSWIKTNYDNNMVEFEEFLNSFLFHVKLALIVLPNINGYSYFEKFNTLGVKLNDIDLLKSLFYSYLREGMNLQNEETINKELKKIDENFFNYFRKNNSNEVDKDKLEHFITFLLVEKGYSKKQIDDLMDSKISPSYKVFSHLLDENTKKSPKEKIDEILYLSKIYNLINAKKIKSDKNEKINNYFEILEELDSSSIDVETLKIIFHYIFSISQGGRRTVFTYLIYQIIKRFCIKNKSNNLEELISWLFEIQRFNFIWKTSFFGGQSIQWNLNKIAEEIKSDRLNSLESFRGKLFELNIFKNTSYDTINQALKYNLMQEKINKKILSSTNKDKLELLFNITYFLRTMDAQDVIGLKNILKNINSIYENNPTYEHIQAKKSDFWNSKSDEERILVESIGNGTILERSLNSSGGKKELKDKLNVVNTSDYNCTLKGLKCALEKVIPEIIVYYDDDHSANKNYNKNDILIDISYFIKNSKHANDKDTNKIGQFDVIQINRREERILNILWNMYHL